MAVSAAPSLNLALSDGKEPRNDAHHDDDCLRYGESGVRYCTVYAYMNEYHGSNKPIRIVT